MPRCNINNIPQKWINDINNILDNIMTISIEAMCTSYNFFLLNIYRHIFFQLQKIRLPINQLNHVTQNWLLQISRNKRRNFAKTINCYRTVRNQYFCSTLYNQYTTIYIKCQLTTFSLQNFISFSTLIYNIRVWVLCTTTNNICQWYMNNICYRND